MRNLYYLILFSVFSLGTTAQVVPTGTIVKTSTLSCTESAINYSVASAANIVSYTWAVQPTKDLIAFTDLNNDKVSFTFSSTAHHTIYLSFTDDSGIDGKANSTLILYQKPKSSFNASFLSSGVPTDLVLTNYSTHYAKNFWSFSDSQGDSSLNVTKSYTASGTYSVTLLTFGDKGCTDSANYDFVLEKTSSLILPTIFTPNGDGANDVYTPIAKGISTLKAFVYNRYGVLVTSWNTVNGFWDGHTYSGEACDDGVYFIVVEAVGADGQTYSLNTTITIAR